MAGNREETGSKYWNLIIKIELWTTNCVLFSFFKPSRLRIKSRTHIGNFIIWSMYERILIILRIMYSYVTYSVNYALHNQLHGTQFFYTSKESLS
jgi:hypothetical protein